MEALTRLVSESLARHGFDRPLDYRRLQWSRWFRCESPHSLLQVPSKPGVFALAEEVIHVAADAFVRQSERCSEAEARRMLAVAQFFEADDMAFVLDRMLSHHNPMRARLASGRYFVRFVAIEDESQRSSICNALNQWIVTSTEKATGIGTHFATSLELTPQAEETQESVARTLLSATADTTAKPADVTKSLGNNSQSLSSRVADANPTGVGPDAASSEHSRIVRPAELSEPPFVIRPTPAAPTTPLHPGAATNIHCPFPSGF